MGFAWTPNLATGVAQIDNQHKELFSQVDRLLTATSQSKGKDEISGMVKFLGNYVVSHFGAEEKAMRLHSYPGFDAHKAQHTAFLSDFGALQQKFDAEGPTTLIVLMIQQKVCNWLIDHVSKTDKALGGFLQGRV